MIKVILSEFALKGICVSSEDGEKVFEVIKKHLNDGRMVEISFFGVEDITTLFLNTAIGKLYEVFSEDELKAKMSVVEASGHDLSTLKNSVDRAKEYFKNPGKFHTAIDEAFDDDH